MLGGGLLAKGPELSLVELDLNAHHLVYAISCYRMMAVWRRGRLAARSEASAGSPAPCRISAWRAGDVRLCACGPSAHQAPLTTEVCLPDANVVIANVA
jgi:hypothetical protein